MDATNTIKIGTYKKKMGLSRKFYDMNTTRMVMAKCGSARRNITTNRVSSVSIENICGNREVTLFRLKKILTVQLGQSR